MVKEWDGCNETKVSLPSCIFRCDNGAKNYYFLAIKNHLDGVGFMSLVYLLVAPIPCRLILQSIF